MTSFWGKSAPMSISYVIFWVFFRPQGAMFFVAIDSTIQPAWNVLRFIPISVLDHLVWRLRECNFKFNAYPPNFKTLLLDYHTRPWMLRLPTVGKSSEVQSPLVLQHKCAIPCNTWDSFSIRLLFGSLLVVAFCRLQYAKEWICKFP